MMLNEEDELFIKAREDLIKKAEQISGQSRQEIAKSHGMSDDEYMKFVGDQLQEARAQLEILLETL